MNYPTWDPQQTQFMLGEQYSLVRADPTSFGIHFTTAHMAQNTWFRQSWEQLVARFSAEDIAFGSTTINSASAVSVSNQT